MGAAWLAAVVAPATLGGAAPSDWHLPPLFPGAPSKVELAAPAAPTARGRLRATGPERGASQELRYHAPWDLELRVEATAQDAGLFLEVFDGEGHLLAADREHEGETSVAASLALAKGAHVRISVGALSRDEGGTVELHAIETPGSPPLPPDSLPRRVEAERAFQRAHELELAGDFAGEESALADSVALLESCAPWDDPRLVMARTGLAITRFNGRKGDFAPDELETTLDLIERTRPLGDPSQLSIRVSLAAVLHERGDVEGARALFEAAIALAQDQGAADSWNVLRARADLADLVCEQGELELARTLATQALASAERSLERGSDLRLRARSQLVRILFESGDRSGARTLQEENVAEMAEAYPAERGVLLAERMTLATLAPESSGWEPIRESVARSLAALQALEEPPAGKVQEALLDVAICEYHLGRYEDAREHLEQALAETADGPHDSFFHILRSDLAGVLGRLGRFEEERALEEQEIAELARGAPRGDRTLLLLRGNYVATLAVLERRDECLAQTRRLAQELDAALAGRPPRSWRELGEAIEEFELPLANVLSLTPTDDAELSAWGFRFAETLREVATGGGLAPAAEHDAELDAARLRVRVARRAVDREAARAGAATLEDSRRLGEVVRASDEAELALSRLLAMRGRATVAIDAAAVARALPAGSAAVGLRRYRRLVLDPTDPMKGHHEDALLAQIVRPDGSLRRVELGALDLVAALVRSWREAVAVDAAPAIDEAGRALAKRVVVPLLEACGGARTLYVCLDDVLHLVPLDALPLPDGALVGERCSVRIMPSFAPLVAPRAATSSSPSLLLFGAIDYGASRNARFAALPATRSEVDGVARLFRETFGRDASLRVGAEATAAEFAALAPQQRFLHLATHGWVDRGSEPPRAPDGEARRDATAAASGDLPASGFRDRVREIAPMTLCGIALAGANERGDGGSSSGRLTAEELAGFDLSGCELVVLSACDTHVGVDDPRAGQGLESLQSALHAAGARASITSLWKVSDLATHDLMLSLYRGLWREKLAPSAALWRAKMELRTAGEPPSRWAGWMLVGDAP